MIKIEASNFIPKRAATYLWGIIPGLVFELTLAIGDPVLARAYIDRVEKIYSFQGYALLVAVLFSCLLVGQTFLFLAWFLDWSIDSGYRLIRYFIFHLTLGSEWLYRAVGRWQGISPRRFARYVWRPIMWARTHKIPFEVRPILLCQRIAALQLLRRKYGIKLAKYPSISADEEWQAWLSIVGKAPTRLRDSFLLMRISLACGLAELSSCYICTVLRNRYFGFMCCVLIFGGLCQAISFTRRRNEPIRRSLDTLAMIVEELSDLDAKPVEKKEASVGAPRLTVQQDDGNNGHKSD